MHFEKFGFDKEQPVLFMDDLLRLYGIDHIKEVALFDHNLLDKS